MSAPQATQILRPSPTFANSRPAYPAPNPVAPGGVFSSEQAHG